MCERCVMCHLRFKSKSFRPPAEGKICHDLSLFFCLSGKCIITHQIYAFVYFLIFLFLEPCVARHAGYIFYNQQSQIVINKISLVNKFAKNEKCIK